MPYSTEEKEAWNQRRELLADQEKLAEEQNSGVSDRQRRRDIRIPPPKEPEVNPEIYRDVIPLVNRGFLTQAAEINGVPFVFKNFNHHEFSLVRLIGGHRPDQVPTSHFWDLFLAYGVFLVDGQNILLDRDRSVPEIAKTFSVFPPDARARVIRHLSELNRRANAATILTEAFATESFSRFRWSQVVGLDLMSPSVTGIAGTERLGLNFAQLTWRSINHYEDLYEQMEREWENAKFVGSCFAGKGIQKVYNQDNDRRRKRKEDIIARKDAIIRQAVFGEEPKDAKQQQGRAVVVAARTTEELSAQLEHDLRGEKDWHDQVIEAYERHIRETQTQQQEHLKQLAASHEEEFGKLGVVGGTDRDRPLSPAEVQERIQRRKQLQAQQVHQQMVQTQFNERLERLNRKQLGYDIDTSVGQTDRDPSDARPIPADRTPGKPFRR
jgi:predicted metal-dependent phosphoesterase TrpH